MKKHLFFFLFIGILVKPLYAIDTLKSKKIALNLHIGGRWQSENIRLPYSGNLPPDVWATDVKASLPYIPQKNIQGFGIMGGLEMLLWQRFSLAFKPVIRYDYLQHIYNQYEIRQKYGWIMDLHFNVGYHWKKNSVGLGYSVINTGQFIDVDFGSAPTKLQIEFPAISAFYTRTFKKRWVAEAKAMINYTDFPTNQNIYNSTLPIYKREYLILSLGCTYKIGLLK